MSKTVLHSRYECLFFIATKALPLNSHDTVADKFEFTEHFNWTSSPETANFEGAIFTFGGPLRANDDSDFIIVPFKQFISSESAFRLCRSEDK